MQLGQEYKEIKMMGKRRRMKTPISDKVYLGFVWAFIVLMLIITILPMMNMLSLGFSNGVYNNKVTFFPRGFTFASFAHILSEREFVVSFGNSVIITALVTILSTLCMAFLAYPLSIPDFPFKKALLIIFLIPMLYSAGIVPSYLLVKALNMTNNLSSLIVLSIFNTFNMLLMKTYFENLPDSVVEAAKIDGASELTMFFRIVFPMSIPVMATTAFYTVFAAWNNYSGAMIYCQTNVNAQPLSYYIYKIVSSTETDITDTFKQINMLNIRSASIIISMIPVLIVYPFVMKNLKEGLVIGSDKG